LDHELDSSNVLSWNDIVGINQSIFDLPAIDAGVSADPPFVSHHADRLLAPRSNASAHACWRRAH
jgi:hypothetical protein